MQAWLYGSHRIEIPVIDWGGRLHVRVSAHLHTRPEDILRLGDVIREAGRAS
jgi:selenocysteine lyase/cysteine desulfurase